MPESTEQPTQAVAPNHKPHFIRRLYNWVLELADHPHAQPALFLIAFAEATFFPIPPDVLLLAMAVAAPTRALRFALICTAGSVAGGVVGYLIGWGLWAQLDTLFYQYIPGFTEEKFELMAQKFADNTFLTIFTAGFTPIPFKIFTVTAGAALVPFLAFLVGATISRTLRFFILAGLIRLWGPGIRDWIDRYFNLLTIVGTILIIAIVYFLH